MAKRRTQNSDNDYFATDDDPMDLTGAFAPVKGPQSVDYDEGDDPVGLTQAFGAIPVEESPYEWNGSSKWSGFDWDNAPGVSNVSDDEAPAESGEADGDEGEAASEAPDAAESTEVADAAEPTETADIAQAPSAEPQAEQAGIAASASAAVGVAASAGASATPAEKRPEGVPTGRGRHAARVPEMTKRQRKMRRTRRILIVLVILLILVIGAVGYFGYQTVKEGQQQGNQQAQQQAAAPKESLKSSEAVDTVETTTAKLADVPNLAQVLNMTQDEALAAIGRGAMVTSSTGVNEEGSVIKTNVTVSLTDEPADSKTRATPTVYLGLAEDGRIMQAGYSASASALGFGSLSFADAVNNEHVVEKTLGKIGVEVPEGSAQLPDDKSAYSTYASDGTTVAQERCSFEGDANVNGVPCSWSSVLSYDYTTQILTGNLSDTVRVIYAYITMQGA